MAFLTAKERDTLYILCNTLIPSLEPEDGDDETLFQLAASDLNVSEEFETAFERVTSAKQQREFKLLLHLLENGFVNGVLSGQWCPISGMPLEAREKLLYRMATHPIEKVRVAFLNLKRLATFLFYTLMPDDNPNPAWDAIGYAPPGLPAPRPAPITPLNIQAPTTLNTEVLIIGSGAGGGVVAGELAAAGYEVMVVEKGDYHRDTDFDGSEINGMERLYEKYGALVTDDTSMAILAGSTLGGGTVVNWSTSFQPPEHVRREWARAFDFRSATSDAYQQSIDAISQRINVNTDESIPNPNNARLEKGCVALGYDVTVIPRNVKGCEDCGFCNYGCAFGAKQSTIKTYLQDAYDHGAKIVVRAHVDRVLSREGRVTGAMLTVRDENDVPHVVNVSAKVVVVSAGTIHTPAILIRSGLRNPNIGANLHLHPTTVISGEFEDDIMPWRGSPQTRCSFEFANLDGDGYGVWLETAPAHPGINGLAQAWINGRQHKRAVQAMPHTANIIILARDKYSGRVVVDQHGQPVVKYRLNKYDAKHLLFGVQQAVRIYAAAGSKEIATAQHTRPTYRPNNGVTLDDFLDQVQNRGLRPSDFALFSAHQMSTCRIAGDVVRGAVDPTGQSYEIENLYVADGSVLPNAPGVNPMITIMGTAHYIAQHIKSRL